MQRSRDREVISFSAPLASHNLCVESFIGPQESDCGCGWITVKVVEYGETLQRNNLLNKPAWTSFWLLGTIWGSSFLLIRIGVENIPATEVVFIRIVIAAVGLNFVRYLRGFSLPTDWRTLRALAIIGLGNATV